MALSDRQARFIDEYLVDCNATQAAIRAGYAARTANREGTRLLSNAVIAAEISRKQQERQKRVELSQDWVVERLKAEAEHRGEDASHGARIKALELLGKHLGMWPNKLKVEGGISIEVVETIVTTREDAAQALSALASTG